MKTTVFAVSKGGVGKTSLSGNVAFMASQEMKTVLIDGDPSGNLSSWFCTEEPEFEFADILIGRATVRETLIELRKDFFILPTFGLSGQLTEFSETKLPNKIHCFTDILTELENMNFKLAVYDISPGMKMLEKRIIASVNEAIIPLTAEFFGIDGVQLFENEIKKIVADFRVSIKHRTIALNIINKSFRRHIKYTDRFNELDYTIFEIPQDSKIPESQIYHLALSEFDKNAKSIPSLEALTQAVIGG